MWFFFHRLLNVSSILKVFSCDFSSTCWLNGVFHKFFMWFSVHGDLILFNGSCLCEPEG